MSNFVLGIFSGLPVLREKEIEAAFLRRIVESIAEFHRERNGRGLNTETGSLATARDI